MIAEPDGTFGTLLFITGVFAIITLWLAQWPPRRPGEIAASLFIWSWLAGELPVHLGLGLVLASTTFIVLGALQTTLGVLGLALVLVGLVGPVLSWREASRVAMHARHEHGVEPAPLGFWRAALPMWARDRALVPSHHRDGHLEVDIYAPHGAPATPRPVLIYVHGGGWVLGFRRFQGRLFMRRMVQAGWVAVSVEYRRWPRATWPEPVDDVRAALAWVRDHLDRFHGDARAIALSGNSAGAHLAALVTLTDRHPIPLAACVSWYGVFDLVDVAERWPHGALERLWAWLILRQPKNAALQRWLDASPVSHVHAQAPAFLLIHGTRDSLVPIAIAHDFAALLDTTTGQRTSVFEVEGAQHAFDVFTSRRGAVAVEVARHFLEQAVGPRSGRSERVAGQGTSEGSDEAYSGTPQERPSE